MANHQGVRVKLTNTQLNKLKSAAKSNTRRATPCTVQKNCKK